MPVAGTVASPARAFTVTVVVAESARAAGTPAATEAPTARTSAAAAANAAPGRWGMGMGSSPRHVADRLSPPTRIRWERSRESFYQRSGALSTILWDRSHVPPPGHRPSCETAGMAPGDVIRDYHRLTSYEVGRDWTTPADDPRLLRDFVPMEAATYPAHCKAYPPGLPAVELPREWSPVAATATSVLAGAHAGGGAGLDLSGLSRVLHLSAGVVRVASVEGRLFRFRAAGSAGGRFPLELYVSARRVDGLADGVHWYDPVGHALLQVGPPADGESSTLIVTGVPWRTAWKYAERGLR